MQNFGWVTAFYSWEVLLLLPNRTGLVKISDLTSAALPALSYGFTWPLLFSLLAYANWFYWHAQRKDSKTIIPGLLLSGAASIVILGPAILLGLFSQLTLTLVFLGALCGFLLPQLHILLGQRLP